MAGVIAKFLMPGRNEPSGVIGAIVGAVIVLAVWGMISRNHTA